MTRQMQQMVQTHADKIELSMKAIIDRNTLTAIYNGNQMEIAPHQLFVRHVSIYLAALNPAKSRKRGEEITLGEYNLTGLTDLALSDKRFEPMPSFDGQPQRQEDRILICVRTANDCEVWSCLDGAL